ncbi:hypothetical protein JTB14_030619 [Gonioctena quinquepunctata]|nr:hypothetical protein JTB14_030619 [Gonioctena quinquepunctata]
MLLLQMWAEKDEVDKIRSGIEEPYSEKDILLQEVSSMCKELNFPEKKKQRQYKDKQILKLGKEERNKCAERPCALHHNMKLKMRKM